MNVVLVMFRENGERRSFSLTRDITVVGRREDADFRIPLTDVSRKHCRLIKDGNQLVIEDLGSANGTFHNGQRVQGDAEISAGDTLQIGPVQFVVQIDGVPSEEDLMGDAVQASSSDTHVSITPPPAFTPPPGPPPMPPAVAQASGTDELDVIADVDALEDVEPDLAFDNISADSVADEEDIIIDLGDAEESEKH